jgi:hypothetical protein
VVVPAVLRDRLVGIVEDGAEDPGVDVVQMADGVSGCVLVGASGLDHQDHAVGAAAEDGSVTGGPEGGVSKMTSSKALRWRPMSWAMRGLPRSSDGLGGAWPAVIA